MREQLVNGAPLVIRPQESAIGDVFSNIIKSAMAHPPAEAALKGREAQLDQAKIGEINQANQARQQQQSAMAEIMQQHLANGNAVVPWTNPDTGAVIPNTDPNAQLESPDQRAARIQPLVAQASLAGDLPAAQRFNEALRTAYALGNSDQARQSMILGGKTIDSNFAPDQAEGDRIRQRNATLNQQTELAKISATPLTDAQEKAKLIQQYQPQLSNRQLATIMDANKGGMNMSMGPDGTATLTSGGTGTFQPGDFGGPAPGSVPISPLGPTTNTTLSTQQGKTLQNQALIDQIMAHAKMVAAAPDSSFGPAGKAQLLAGDAATAGSGVANLIASMGLKGNAAANYIQQTKDAALKNGASPETIKQIFSGNPDIMALQYSADGLKGPVAQALAGMDGGRAAPSEYLKEAASLVEDPTDLGSGKVRSLTALQTLAHTLAGNSNVYGGARKADVGRLPIDDLVDPIVKGPLPPQAEAGGNNVLPNPVTNTAPDGSVITTNSMPMANAPAAIQAQAPQAQPLPPVSLPGTSNVPAPAFDPGTPTNNIPISTPAAASMASAMAPAPAPSGPIQVKTRADAMALPPGTPFIDPYGVQRVRPNVSSPDGGAPAGSTPVSATDNVGAFQ